jgi:hypothetical protein
MTTAVEGLVKLFEGLSDAIVQQAINEWQKSHPSTRYVVLAGGEEDRLDRGDVYVFKQTYATRLDALTAIYKGVQELFNDEEEYLDEIASDHCEVSCIGGDLTSPSFVVCEDIGGYYQIEDVGS